MKKFFTAAAMATAITAAGTTGFAAANPFEDVAADHWAYDAVAQLAADGVIEGYGDGTFRGDQEITRFEMAQMVARAMAKNGVSAADKAMIDKLAAEFADELNALGVRVANLEKKVDNVKWTGELRYDYKRSRKDGNASHKNKNFIRLRLDPTMTINKHWIAGGRIEIATDMNSAKNTGAVDETTDHMQAQRAFAQGTYGNVQITLGKFAHWTNIDGQMMFDDNVAGGRVVFGKDVKASLLVSRVDHKGRNGMIDYSQGGGTISWQAIEIYSDNGQKFSWGASYNNIKNKELLSNEKNFRKDSLHIWEVGLGYRFDKNWKLSGAYAGSNSDAIVKDRNKAWNVQIDYKGANKKQAGSYGIYAAYRHVGAGAVIVPTYDCIDVDRKGVELGFTYTLAQNIQWKGAYFWGKVMDGNNTKTNTIWTRIACFF
ncbi:MAG: S-layer homology domain-containing protein [Schwartzia sp.]|nr:S-layer homology domain-containing protein [Schwartzia sp. (in: firmicutes)]